MGYRPQGSKTDSWGESPQNLIFFVYTVHAYISYVNIQCMVLNLHEAAMQGWVPSWKQQQISPQGHLLLQLSPLFSSPLWSKTSWKTCHYFLTLPLSPFFLSPLQSACHWPSQPALAKAAVVSTSPNPVVDFPSSSRWTCGLHWYS